MLARVDMVSRAAAFETVAFRFFLHMAAAEIPGIVPTGMLMTVMFRWL